MKYSETHRKAEETKHIDPEYGASAFYAPIVSQIANRVQARHLLDYGCGKAALMRELKVGHDLKIQVYDPAIPSFAGDPIPAQMVTCVNVLEHVEPGCLDAVLDDLVRVTEAVGFFTISHEESHDLSWWLDKIMPRFDLQTLQVTPEGVYMIVYAKPKPLLETIQ